MSLWKRQAGICEQYGAAFVPTDTEQIIGAASNLGTGLLPLNGLRHPGRDSTSGWYLWAGEELSQADDFFQPLHAVHLQGVCPAVIPYLGLAPGWRFLLAGDHADVWFDSELVKE